MSIRARNGFEDNNLQQRIVPEDVMENHIFSRRASLIFRTYPFAPLSSTAPNHSALRPGTSEPLQRRARHVVSSVVPRFATVSPRAPVSTYNRAPAVAIPGSPHQYLNHLRRPAPPETMTHPST